RTPGRGARHGPVDRGRGTPAGPRRGRGPSLEAGPGGGAPRAGLRATSAGPGRGPPRQLPLPCPRRRAPGPRVRHEPRPRRGHRRRPAGPAARPAARPAAGLVLRGVRRSRPRERLNDDRSVVTLGSGQSTPTFGPPTTSTEQGAAMLTALDTLPSTSPLNPPRPREPVTTRLASSSTA